MNKIYNIVKLFMIVVLIALQSCGDDFLDQVPSNQQSPESIKTISDAQLVLNGAYDLMQSNSYYNASIITNNDARADDMQTAEWGRIEDMYMYNYTADVDYSSGIWNQPWTVIRQVNNLLIIWVLIIL